jgi:uncharacterized repeat protein (TIGR02543 family)
MKRPSGSYVYRIVALLCVLAFLYPAGIVEARGAHNAGTESAFASDDFKFLTLDEYTLTVNVVGNGTVTKNPDQPTYHDNDVVQLTATPDAGWTFDGWSGDVTGTDNPTTVTMDGDKTVTANFELIPQHTLTMAVSPLGGGTTTPSVGTHDYAEGTVVPITATAAAGYQFVNWTGDVTGTDNPTTVTMDGDKTVTANFQTSSVIDVWYGSDQPFGQIGSNAQTWVNVLGNVSDPDGVASLVYSLNGGPVSTLSIGPDGRRLESAGDFNIDIAYTDLVNGPNQVLITATDGLGTQSTEMVTVTYSSGNVWPLPYSIDWSSAPSIQDVAQVVDGLWTLEADSVRILEPGYDRLIAIGDVSWTDYEVMVPVTIHNMWGDGGAGILLRWNGNTDYPISGWQPKTGWNPLGAIGWFRYNRLEFWGNDDEIIAWVSRCACRRYRAKADCTASKSGRMVSLSPQNGI